jgi:hypothetical protein
MRHVALLLLWPLAASAQTAKPEEFSTVEGRVLNAANGEPVGKASLLLMRTDSTQASYDWTRSYAASSDSTGKFATRNVDPGKYRLRASRNGFVTLEYGARASRPSGTALDLERPQQLKDVDLRLTPHGVIAGRVLDADGEPLAGAQIQLLRSQYVNGRKTLSTTNTVFTNDLGEYRYAGLTPGKYYVYAEDFAGAPPTSVSEEDYVPVYYPGARDTAGAVPVDVAAGAQVRTVDMILRKARTAIVKGRVVVELPDARGIPSVRLFPRVEHNSRAASTFRGPAAKVNAAGAFEIRGLTPGSYKVVASIAKGGLWYTGQTTVEVAGANIEDVVVTIGSGVSVTGRIRVDGETTQDLQNPHIELQRGGPTVDSILLEGTYRIAKDGTFRLEDLDPYRYGILIGGLPDGFYTKSIRVGEADITYSGLDLTSGAPGEVDILVSPKAGLVSGVARSLNTSQPPPGATAVLIPKEKERLEISVFYQQTTTDQYGRFTFKNVVPGEYQVYAWEDVESSAWMDPGFMKPLEGKGESVTVGEGAQANVQVNLIPADSEEEKPKSTNGGAQR